MDLRNYISALRFGNAKLLLSDIQGFGGLTTGNVYHVIKKTVSFYNQFLRTFNVTYADGSKAVCPDEGYVTATAATALLNTGIQDALNKTVANRNDYVLLQSSQDDYDIDAALTMSKKSTHLVCQGGLGMDVGATNACRIHQLGNYAIIAESQSNLEVAGLYLKQYADASVITVANGTYALNNHHNFFPLSWSAAPAAIILCSGDGGAWGQVSHHNFFESQGGDDVTAAVMITIGSSATGAKCDHNEFFIGDGNIATIGISQAATKGTANFNVFNTAGTDGSFTHCISLGTWATAVGNRGTVADSILITGGTASYSLSDNMNGASGGLIDEA